MHAPIGGGSTKYQLSCVEPARINLKDTTKHTNNKGATHPVVGPTAVAMKIDPTSFSTSC